MLRPQPCLADVTNVTAAQAVPQNVKKLTLKEVVRSGMGDEVEMFAKDKLESLKSVKRWSEHLEREDIRLRPLKSGDDRRGFLQVLAQLTVVGDLSPQQFQEKFLKMAAIGREYIVVGVKVGEGGAEERVVGTATLTLEDKFIHAAGSRSRIEDVCVHSDFRSLKLGRILVEVLVELAEILGTYKCSLECKDHLVGFYEKMGFKKDVGNNFMVQRFKHD